MCVRVCVCACMSVACYMKEGEMFMMKKVLIKSRKGGWGKGKEGG